MVTKQKVKSKKYTVMGDTKNIFLGIDLFLVLDDDSIGQEVNVLGGTFKITQNGLILVLAEPEWVLTLQEVYVEPEVEENKLIINRTFEIYFESREIEVKTKCTYEELFYALQQEWKLINQMKVVIEIPSVLPFDYSERLNLFTFKEDWNFKDNNFSMLSNGSFTRIGKDGRSK